MGKYMKKAFVIALAVLLCMTACSKQKNDTKNDASVKTPAAVESAQKPMDPNATEAVTGATEPANTVNEDANDVDEQYGESEDGIRAIFKDSAMMTEEELEAILHKLEACEVKNVGEWYNLRDCTAYKVFNELASGTGHSRKIDPVSRRNVYLKVLKESEVAAVRDFIYSRIDLAGMRTGSNLVAASELDPDVVNQFIDIVRKEKDEIALSTAVGYLATVAGVEKIASASDFLFDTAATHAMASVRRALVENIDGTRFRELDKAKTAIMQLCKDGDSETRDAACGKIIDFDVPDAVNLASEYLNDAGKSGSHGAIVSSLNRKWLDADHPDASAYQIVRQYLSKEPRNENLPVWTAISSLSASAGAWNSKEDETYKSWASAATFYKPEEFVSVLCNIILDSNASYFSRLNSIDQVIRFGSIDDLKPLAEELSKREDKNEARLLDDLNRKIEEITNPKMKHPGLMMPRPNLEQE